MRFPAIWEHFCQKFDLVRHVVVLHFLRISELQGLALDPCLNDFALRTRDAARTSAFRVSSANTKLHPPSPKYFCLRYAPESRHGKGGGAPSSPNISTQYITQSVRGSYRFGIAAAVPAVSVSAAGNIIGVSALTIQRIVRLTRTSHTIMFVMKEFLMSSEVGVATLLVPVLLYNLRFPRKKYSDFLETCWMGIKWGASTCPIDNDAASVGAVLANR